MFQKKRKAPTPLQKLKASQKPKRKTIPQLIKEADTWFSRYIRLRDSEYIGGAWIAECISCGRKMTVIHSDGRWDRTVNAGHYITRGHKGLRWDEYNVHAQCARDNAWADKVWMITSYRKNLCLKIGDDAVLDLEIRAKESYKPTRDELEQVIADSKEGIEHRLKNSHNYTRNRSNESRA